MANLNAAALSQFTTKATVVSNLVLINPNENVGYQSQNQPSPGFLSSIVDFVTNQSPKFLFHYEGENTITLSADITDHFVEDNTSIQDQIALKPKIVTVHGFIGELNDVPPRILTPLKTIAEKLTDVGAYKPALTARALIAYNRAAQLYQVASSATNSLVNAWNSLPLLGGKSQSRQQKAYLQFESYFDQRNLFTIQTPWAIFKNMAIQNLRAIQDEETRMITDFEITFKEIRFASTQVINIANVSQGRLQSQAASASNNGVSTPSTSTGLGSAINTNIPGVVGP